MTIVDTDHCEQIVAALADRQLLLALDNVEQLIETTGPYLSSS